MRTTLRALATQAAMVALFAFAIAWHFMVTSAELVLRDGEGLDDARISLQTLSARVSVEILNPAGMHRVLAAMAERGWWLLPILVQAVFASSVSMLGRWQRRALWTTLVLYGIPALGGCALVAWTPVNLTEGSLDGELLRERSMEWGACFLLWLNCLVALLGKRPRAQPADASGGSALHTQV